MKRTVGCRVGALRCHFNCAVNRVAPAATLLSFTKS